MAHNVSCVRYRISQLELKCGAHVDTWHNAIGGKSNGWWIKWIRNPMSQLELDMWQRGEQKETSFLQFGLIRAVGERRRADFENGGFLERENATSL